MKGVYSRTWFIGKKERFEKYKRSSSRIQEKVKYKSKKIRKVEYSREKRF